MNSMRVQGDPLAVWHTMFRWSDRLVAVGYLGIVVYGHSLDSGEGLWWPWVVASELPGVLLLLSRMIPMGIACVMSAGVALASFIVCDASTMPGNVVWHHVHTWVAPVLFLYCLMRWVYMIADWLSVRSLRSTTISGE
jgi:hypothetical protein